MLHETVARFNEVEESDLVVDHGYLTTVRTEAVADFSPHPNIKIKRGDECFIVHINKLADEKLTTPRKQILGDLEDIANFDVDDMEGAKKIHVIGFTNTHITRMAQRLGFITLEMQVHDEMRDDVIALSKPNYDGPIMMCYQIGRDFLKRFGTTEDY